MKNIVLVGFMGTGKTTVGKRLAEKLGRDFLELDEIIERKEGISIREIFEKKGEPYFRKLEKEIVKEASQRQDLIISVGGGSIVDMENFNNLRMSGVLICLEASPNVIFERTKGIKDRPLLNVRDTREKIKNLLQIRQEYYRKADYFINTDNLTVDEVAERIQKLVR